MNRTSHKNVQYPNRMHELPSQFMPKPTPFVYCRKGDASLDNIATVPAPKPSPLPPVPACRLAPPGFFSEGVPPFGIMACDPGKSSKAGSATSTACLLCRSVAKRMGLRMTLVNLVGVDTSFTLRDREFSTPRSAGRYSWPEQSNGAEECRACPKGRYLPGVGASSESTCTVCPGGKASPAGSGGEQSCASSGPLVFLLIGAL